MDDTVCVDRSFRGCIVGILEHLLRLAATLNEHMKMDKKQKKRIEVINKKLQSLRPRLAGARAQADEPGEVKQLEDEIASLEAEAKEIRESK